LKNNIARLVPAVQREVQEALARRQKREAQAAVRRLSAIVESSDDAIIGKDLEGIITSWNRGAERLYGYTAGEIIRQPISILMPPEKATELADIMLVIAGGGSIDQYETSRRRKDGTLVDVAVTISPVMDSSGTLIGASSIARDITVRKRAEQALAEKARLLDLSSDAILVRDAQDRIAYWNQGAVEAYGFTAEEALGRSPYSLLCTEFPAPLEHIFETLHRDGSWTGELVQRRKDAAKITVSSRWALDRTAEKGPAILETNRDITDRKQAEAALIRSEKLASVGRMAATIAHEVNNPLAAVMNSVYIANSDPTLSPQTKDALNTADQELRRVAHIAAQTLVFCRETGIRAQLKLPQIIDEVLGVYAQKLRHRGITVQQRYRCGDCGMTCDFCLAANAGELRHVISNLLGNAMDALQNNGILHIRLSRTASRDGSPIVRLTMADNGCGIRTENLKRVFEPFFTTKETVGTGLGLWVTEQIIQKYGGSIRVRSQASIGTVFSIALPATLIAAQPELKQPTPQFPNSKTA
jgi:PAS domain S-box-containing protein